MKEAMINSMKIGIHDELYTPDYAVYPLIPYLDKDKVYWECTDYGNSNITKVLKRKGFKDPCGLTRVGFATTYFRKG